MPNKLFYWKSKQDPPMTTTRMAEILGIKQGWASTLVNQEDVDLTNRCSYDVAIRIELLTDGEVTVEDMMLPEGELEELRKYIITERSKRLKKVYV